MQICHVGCQSKGFYISYPYTRLILHKKSFFTPFWSILRHFYPIFGHFFNSETETSYRYVMWGVNQEGFIYLIHILHSFFIKNDFLSLFWGIFTLFSVIFWTWEQKLLTDMSCGCQSRGFYISYPYTRLIPHKKMIFYLHFWSFWGIFTLFSDIFLTLIHKLTHYVGCPLKEIYMYNSYTRLIIHQMTFYPILGTNLVTFRILGIRRSAQYIVLNQ